MQCTREGSSSMSWAGVADRVLTFSSSSCVSLPYPSTRVSRVSQSVATLRSRLLVYPVAGDCADLHAVLLKCPLGRHGLLSEVSVRNFREVEGGALSYSERTCS